MAEQQDYFHRHSRSWKLNKKKTNCCDISKDNKYLLVETSILDSKPDIHKTKQY